MNTRNRSLLMAALVLAWFGVFAVAAVIGQGWGAALPLAVAAIPTAIVYYVWGGRDSDFEAMLIGRRADEREALSRTQARAVAGTAMYAVAVVCAAAAFTLQNTGGWSRNWPFVVVVLVGTVAYWWAGRDAGARVRIGGRADEREKLIRTRARALAGNAMYAAAALGAAAELVLRDTQHRGTYWSFSLIAVTGGVACLIGLRRYGNPGEEGHREPREHDNDPSPTRQRNAVWPLSKQQSAGATRPTRP